MVEIATTAHNRPASGLGGQVRQSDRSSRLVLSSWIGAVVVAFAGCAWVRSPAPLAVNAGNAATVLAQALARELEVDPCTRVTLYPGVDRPALWSVAKPLCRDVAGELSRLGFDVSTTPSAVAVTDPLTLWLRVEDERVTASVERVPPVTAGRRRAGRGDVVCRASYASIPPPLKDVERPAVPGHRWIAGPTLPVRVSALVPDDAASGERSTSDVLAATSSGTLRLRVRTGGGDDVRVDVSPTDDVPWEWQPLSLVDERSGERRDVPVRASIPLAREPDAFAALTGDGRIVYGAPLGLWGAPEPGYGAGLAPIGTGILTATDAPPGRPDALVVLVIGPDRRLIETARIPIGVHGAVALAEVDTDGDDALDVVLALDVPGGTQIVVLVSEAPA